LSPASPLAESGQYGLDVAGVENELRVGAEDSRRQEPKLLASAKKPGPGSLPPLWWTSADHDGSGPSWLRRTGATC
jgi:hypothetical protein